MTYIINISDPKCWNNLVLENKDKILIILNKMRPLFNQYMSFLRLGYQTYKFFRGIILYEKEIEEIAKILQIEFLLFQLTYELCSACTSAILLSDNRFVHVRTMDWSMLELKDITVKVQIHSNGKYLFDGITWAGFVGIFTGIKKNKYSVALNYRRSANPNFIANITSLLSGYYPNAFFIRNLLESSDSPNIIKHVKLIAPAYYTVLTSPNEENSIRSVIVRDRNSYFLKEAPCVQTNCDEIDSDCDIMYSYERIRYMNQILNANPSISELLSHISKYPVNNENTIYTTIMTPDEGFIYFAI